MRSQMPALPLLIGLLLTTPLSPLVIPKAVGASQTTVMWQEGKAICIIRGTAYDVPMPPNSSLDEVQDYCQVLEHWTDEEVEISANESKRVE